MRISYLLSLIMGFIVIYITLTTTTNKSFTPDRSVVKYCGFIESISINNINLYISILIINLIHLLKTVHLYPEEIYFISLNFTICSIVCAGVITAIFFEYSKDLPQFFKNSIYVVSFLGTGFFVYLSSVFGSTKISDVLNVGSLNVKYAFAAATAIYFFRILSIISLVLAIFYIFIIIFYLYKFNEISKFTNKLCRIILMDFLVLATMAFGPWSNIVSNQFFIDLLITRIAFDADSVSPKFCKSIHNKKFVNLINENSFSSSFLPIATSLDSGYLMVATKNTPSNKKLSEYDRSTYEKNSPIIIDYVKCDRVFENDN